MSKAKSKVAPGLPGPDMTAFLHRIFYRVQLPKKETKALKEDFLRLFAFYAKNGMDAKAIEARIGDDILGSFYRPASPGQWYRLDSAAKVYPLSMTHTHMTVFRVSAYMQETVEPAVLQVALLSTVKRFPVFSTAVRRGIFWHYFDAVRCRFAVRPEEAPPCSSFDLGHRQTPCFQVLYYKDRISLEIFHALTDGTGAMVFLQTLVKEYLRLLGHSAAENVNLPRLSDCPREEETENAFSRAEKQHKGSGFLQKPALQPGAGRAKRKNARILHFIMPTASLVDAAKKADCTVTLLLTRVLFAAVKETVLLAEPKDLMQVQIPVNMRRFYPSETLRNFSLYAVISVPYGADTNASLLPELSRQLAAQTSEESLAQMLYSANQLASGRLVRMIPLVLKNFVLKKIYGFLGERVLSSTLSNLGRVEADFGTHVRFFDFVLGPSCKTNTKCTLVSYKDTAVLTVTDSMKDIQFVSTVAGELTKMGIPFQIEGVS
ncbi:MAG: hypothetical protein IJN25_10525 [Clostridia bacterium]|nr:hypothetical protein [Clostridia bacterium]